MQNLKIRTVLQVLSIIVFCMMIVSITVVFYLGKTVAQERDQHNYEKEYNKAGQQLLSASDYLTTQIRGYVKFGDKTFYDNYQTELTKTKSREKAIEKLEDLGTEEKYMTFLKHALDKSNELAILEKEAMNQVEGKNFNEARKIVYGAEYSQKKNQIMEEINEFVALINMQSEIATHIATTKIRQMMWTLYAALAVFSVVILYTLTFINRRVHILCRLQGRMNQLSDNDGDLTQRIEVTRQDEIGLIGQGFNQFIPIFIRAREKLTLL